MDLQIKDRVALITGATDGMGFETARILAAEGCKLVLSDKEIGPSNFWMSDKTLAMESAAAQTPGSCLLVCTTATVNENTMKGQSQQRVHYQHLAHRDVGQRTGKVVHEQALGSSCASPSPFASRLCRRLSRSQDLNSAGAFQELATA